MTQHTPEPWSYGEDNDCWYVSVGDTQIAYGLSEENACHIVACVDACAGIVNPDIKIPKLQEALIEAVEQLQKAEQQSAELQTKYDDLYGGALRQSAVVVDLREALVMYGRHRGTCDSGRITARHDGKQVINSCNCGLNEAIAKAGA